MYTIRRLDIRMSDYLMHILYGYDCFNTLLLSSAHSTHTSPQRFSHEEISISKFNDQLWESMLCQSRGRMQATIQQAYIQYNIICMREGKSIRKDPDILDKIPRDITKSILELIRKLKQ